jgi:hypothetical protein
MVPHGVDAPAGRELRFGLDSGGRLEQLSRGRRSAARASSSA